MATIMAAKAYPATYGSRLGTPEMMDLRVAFLRPRMSIRPRITRFWKSTKNISA